jgi:hypothetical protein
MPADPPPDEHVQRAARTYGAAADHYRRDALSFWDKFGTATVSRLRLAPGDTVRAGVPDPAVAAAAGQHHLDHPDRFWDVVLGSGYRATVDALSPDRRDRLRERLLAGLRSDGVTSLRTDVVYATAERPEADGRRSPAIA